MSAQHDKPSFEAFSQEMMMGCKETDQICREIVKKLCQLEEAHNEKHTTGYGIHDDDNEAFNAMPNAAYDLAHQTKGILEEQSKDMKDIIKILEKSDLDHQACEEMFYLQERSFSKILTVEKLWKDLADAYGFPIDRPSRMAKL